VVRKYRSRISLAVALIGIAFTLACFVLPTIKIHQTAIGTGPTLPYGNQTSTLSGYLIPEVNQGSRITIVVTGYTPGSLTMSIFPSNGGDLGVSGNVLFFLTSANFTKPIETVSFISPATQPYGIFVNSQNRTQFVIAVDGTWSPYHSLTDYISEGLFTVLGGFLAYSYFRHWEYRKNLEEEATREATQKPEAPPGSQDL
jgi:hypothetical protein